MEASRTKLEELKLQIEQFKSRNDWRGIVDLFDISKLAEQHPAVWNHAEILSEIAFAYGKLSECSSRAPKSPSDLKELSNYRQMAYTLYHRCLEIQPNNIRYLSGLAYRHYYAVIELTNRCRRDGDALVELEAAVKYLDRVLEIEPAHISSLYRKAYLLVDKLPNLVRYGTSPRAEALRPQLQSLISEGAEHYRQLITFWEENNDQYRKQRSKKEYVKALYRLGSHYLDTLDVVWNRLLQDLMARFPIDQVFSDKEIRTIQLARECLEKCWQAECSLNGDLSFGNTDELHRQGRRWALKPQFKLYRLGLLYLNIYAAVKTDSRYDEKKEKHYWDQAQDALKGAKRLAERDGQKTDYIQERQARGFILAGQYADAISVIGSEREGYIGNTLALSYWLNEEPHRAQALLEELADNPRNRSRRVSRMYLMLLYSQAGQPEKSAALSKLMREEYGESFYYDN